MCGVLLSGCRTPEEILFAEGEKQMRRLAFAAAETTFTAYIALWPDSPEGYYSRGLARVGLDRFGDAMTDFDRVVWISPDDTDARWMRFRIRESIITVLGDSARPTAYERPLLFTLISALTVLQTEELSALLRYDPYDVAALCERGILLRKSGRFEEARTDLNTALLNAPRDVQSRTERGNLFLDLGDYAAALNDYDAALTACDTCTWLLYNKALALRRAGRLPEAVQTLEVLIAADSLDGGTWFMLGECRMASGDRNGARKAFARSAALGIPEAGDRLQELSR